MFTPHRKVIWFAVFSRLLIFFLSAAFNFILPDHDADAFQSPRDPSDKEWSSLDDFVKYLFGGLVRWDAQYFIHIALYGYTYENCLAFFPLYPMSVRVLAVCLLYPLEGFISHYSAFVLSSVVVNFIIFILSASVLYRLGLQVLRSEQLAYKAAILYCVNPATIFFVAPYSETLFACLTFYGMLKCGSGSTDHFSVGCGLPFGLGAVQRSNGILNLGFIFHKKLKHFLHFVMPGTKAKAKHLDSFLLAPLLLIAPVIYLISLIGEILLSVIPFVLFQGYGYYKFCIVPDHNLPNFIVSYAETNELRLPGTASLKPPINHKEHWCNSSVPLAYSYIQDHYWNVGFLRYYQWKQIPNFLLAMPVVWIIFTYAYRFAKQHPHLCCTLGLWKDLSCTDTKVIEKLRVQMKQNKIKFAPEMFVYVVHVTFLTVFCILCIHVQVTTRMIASSSPILYWFTAYHFSNKRRNVLEERVDSLENLQSRWKVFILTDPAPNREAKLIQYYYLAYFIVGTALFSNFFPWT
ncbi:GPI mannosyltransferase 2 [Zootermopsis nevadensis]|uniref:GPI mannosyltransferase 2 n=1 Tax=Zootermopsis nevadensis TaxID=136037 RepID=A0A067RI12_ZOONE|nr:GPI mannosyltransferase 2 [Zootermopsis nevadensis]